MSVIDNITDEAKKKLEELKANANEGKGYVEGQTDQVKDEVETSN